MYNTDTNKSEMQMVSTFRSWQHGELRMKVNTQKWIVVLAGRVREQTHAHKVTVTVLMMETKQMIIIKPQEIMIANLAIKFKLNLLPHMVYLEWIQSERHIF